jgi:hypothetical protein
LRQSGQGQLQEIGAQRMCVWVSRYKDRGNAYKVGEELDLPYSTVRARLTEIIRAMGYEPGAEPKDLVIEVPPEKRKSILNDLAHGKITAEDAVKLLQGE